MVKVSLLQRCVPTFSVTPEIGIYTSLIRAGSLSHYCLDQKGATVVVSLPLYSSYSVWTPKGGDTSDETVHRCILPRGRYNDNFAINCNRNIIVKWSIVFYIFVVVANTHMFCWTLSLMSLAVKNSCQPLPWHYDPADSSATQSQHCVCCCIGIKVLPNYNADHIHFVLTVALGIIL